MSPAGAARDRQDKYVGWGNHAVGIRPSLDAPGCRERSDAVGQLHTLGSEVGDVATQGADLERLLSEQHVQHHHSGHQHGDQCRREEEEAGMERRAAAPARRGARNGRSRRGSRRSPCGRGRAPRRRRRSRHARLACGNAHAATSERSAARNFALRARGFSRISSGVGTSGFFVRTLRRSSSRKPRLTRPSSSEW